MKSRTARVLARVSLAGIGIACAFWIVPAPLAGYWHTPLSDCLCDSKNLIAFEGGKVYQWASGHGQVKEEFGTYRRGVYWAEWNTGEGTGKRSSWLVLHADCNTHRCRAS